MAFAPDVHVFPGGRVDREDADPTLLARSVVGPDRAARSLGGDLSPELAVATHVAAVRELFEEAGVLLADRGSVDGPAGDGTPDAFEALSARDLGAARTALVAGDATFGTVIAELGLRLRTDLLVPLSRWVTPPTMPRRFDARFFAAELPAGARVSFEGDEVADHTWLTPGSALRAMSDGGFPMWVPTSATLQQLEHARSVAEVRERLAPGPLGDVELKVIAPNVTRITMPAGGGVAGQPICAYLVGRRRCVLVDPGDPTGPALDRAVAVAAEREASIAAIALTQAGPDHAGGAEALAEILGIPILAGPGAGDPLPYAVVTLEDGALLPGPDVAVTALHAPGPRPEHLALVVDDGAERLILAGDLDGGHGSRTIAPVPDAPARARSLARLEALAPRSLWWFGHPADNDGVDGGDPGPEAPRDA
jgi:glyoxylase-like metal-dependent hydrolase (beta-lactamase superfamily II)/8-oxo-dGTP pyrophosphatase MutT (NUDIX family)